MATKAQEKQGPDDNVLPFIKPGSGEPAVKADIDEGYMRLANTLVEAVCMVELSGRQLRVFMAVIRLTYGWGGKKVDWLSASQLSETVRCRDLSSIRADLRELKSRNLIIQQGRKIGPNPAISEWVYDRRKTGRKRIENEVKTPSSAKGETGRKHPANEVKTPCEQGENAPQNEVFSPPTKERKDINTKDINTKDSEAPPTNEELAVHAIEYLNHKTGRNFQDAEANTRLVIGRLKEGHTIQSVFAVIDHKCAEWLHCKKMNGYLRPKTLFNAVNFNQYVGMVGTPVAKTAQQELDDWRPPGVEDDGDFFDADYEDLTRD
jgi:phage replication O-like protein O